MENKFILLLKAGTGFELGSGDFLNGHLGNRNTDLDFVQHRSDRCTQILCYFVNTDFKQINCVKTDIYGLTKLSKKSDGFSLGF